MLEIISLQAEHAGILEDVLPQDIIRRIAGYEASGLAFAEEDGSMAASIVIQPDEEGSAQILWLYTEPHLRRQGLATDLLREAGIVCQELGGFYRITLESTRDPEEEDSLYGFCKARGFEIEASPVGCFSVTLGAARKQERLSGKNPKGVVSYGALTQTERKRLLDEGQDLEELMSENRIEEEMSCMFLREGEIESLLILEREESGLSVAWARTSAASPQQIVLLLQYAISHSDRYPDDTPIHIPVLNDVSEKLAKKLFGDDLKRTEEGYVATIALFGDEE